MANRETDHNWYTLCQRQIIDALFTSSGDRDAARELFVSNARNTPKIIEEALYAFWWQNWENLREIYQRSVTLSSTEAVLP
jgi:hypothetical protein